MKRFFAVISLVLAFSLMLSVPAYAAEEIARGSNYFVYSSTYIDKSGNTLEIWFDVTAKSTMQKLGASEIKVQQSSDGSNWTTVATYSMDDYSNMVASNTVSHASHVTYTASSGYYYRAKTTFYAKNSSGSAVMTHYTSYVTVG